MERKSDLELIEEALEWQAEIRKLPAFQAYATTEFRKELEEAEAKTRRLLSAVRSGQQLPSSFRSGMEQYLQDVQAQHAQLSTYATAADVEQYLSFMHEVLAHVEALRLHPRWGAIKAALPWAATSLDDLEAATRKGIGEAESDPTGQLKSVLDFAEGAASRALAALQKNLEGLDSASGSDRPPDPPLTN